AGERRLRALKELGEVEAPVYIKDDANPAARVAENVVRQDLHPIEEGRAYQALLAPSGGKKLSVTALAKTLGINVDRIRRRLKLVVLPTEISDIIISGSPIAEFTDELVEMCEKLGAENVARFVESYLEPLSAMAATPPGERIYALEE